MDAKKKRVKVGGRAKGTTNKPFPAPGWTNKILKTNRQRFERAIKSANPDAVALGYAALFLADALRQHDEQQTPPK